MSPNPPNVGMLMLYMDGFAHTIIAFEMAQQLNETLAHR